MTQWTPEMVDAIRTHAAAGLRCPEISKRTGIAIGKIRKKAAREGIMLNVTRAHRAVYDEAQILTLRAQNLSYVTIAANIGVSADTVRHVIARNTKAHALAVKPPKVAAQHAAYGQPVALVPSGPTRTCQWIHTTVRPHVMCGKPSLTGWSWCAEHYRRVFVPMRAAMRTAFVLALLLAATPAFATPPPVGSEDYKAMMPHAGWITRQHDVVGRWCCDPGDAALVEQRIVADHYEIRPLHPDAGRGIPPQWQRVLPAHFADLRGQTNEVGLPMAWYWEGRPQCFIPEAGG